jgi:hypothetical protein
MTTDYPFKDSSILSPSNMMFSNSPSLISQSPYVDEIIPFDERTKSLFRRAKTLDTLFEELKNAGFKQIQEETFTFEYLQNSVTAEDWIYLIENRVWTQFSEENINEQQMKDSIYHVRKQFESPINFQTVAKQTITKCCVE